jgi:hypothetical protein
MHTISVRRPFPCHILFIPNVIFCWVSLPTYSISNSIPCHVEYDIFHNMPFSYTAMISEMVNYAGFYYTWSTVRTKIVFLENSVPLLSRNNIMLGSVAVFITTRHQKMILLIWWKDIHNFFINLWSLPNYKSKHYLQSSYHLSFNLCNNLNTVTNQQRYLQDLRISQHCSWGFRSTRIWCCVNTWVVPPVLRGSSGSPFEGQVVPADILAP